MTIIDTITHAETELAQAGIESARLDAEVLLAHIMSQERADLYMHRSNALDTPTAQRFEDAVRRRALGCPVAYITGVKEFWSIPIQVTPDVLIPRPDTETVVEAALATAREIDGAVRILDLCTGSGCIAAALASELPAASFTVCDLSEQALGVARINLAFAGERIEFLAGDLFDALGSGKTASPFDFIVSNPPYISDGEMKGLPRDIADFEPKQALAAGESGLDFISRIIEDAPRFLKAGGWLFMEVGAGQAAACMSLATSTEGYDTVKTFRDLAGIERVVALRRAWNGS
jgi:release factor glutamine methyltransferase